MADDIRITLTEVQRRMEAGENVLLVDSRNPVEWGGATTKAKGAVRVGVGEVEEKIDKIPKGALIAAYCT